jgi:hypothetical protein
MLSFEVVVVDEVLDETVESELDDDELDES